MSFIDERMIYDENGKRLSDKIGVLSDLQTQNKDSLVGAVNEHAAQLAERATKSDDLFYLRPEWQTNWNSSDSTASIQQCIDLLYSLGGGIVLLRDKTYNISTIKLRKNVAIKGLGKSSILKQLASNSTTETGLIRIYEDDASYWEIRDLVLDGNKSNTANTLNGIHVTRVNYPSTQYDFDTHGLIENVEVKNFNGDGLLFDINCRETRVNNVKTHDNNLSGFEILANDMFFTNCTSWSNGKHGWFVNGSNGDLRFVNCKGFYNTINNLNVYQTKSLNFTCCSFQESYQHGVYMSQSKNINMVGIHFGSNGIQTVRTYHQLVIDNCTNVIANGEFADWHVNYSEGGVVNRCVWMKNNSTKITINAILKEEEIELWRFLSINSDSPDSYNTSKITCNSIDMLIAYATLYMSGSNLYTTLSNTETLINFNGSQVIVGYDFNQNMQTIVDKTNSQFIVPKTGLYHLDFQIECFGMSSENQLDIYLYRNRNGTETQLRNWHYQNNDTQTISVIYSFVKGDILKFKAKSPTNSTIAITNLNLLSLT